MSSSPITTLSSPHRVPIPLFETVSSFREWRQRARDRHKSVGFVATMGALHDGHLSLVRRSLAENDLTVVSIFVNPAQFGPHEDLGTYPRTLAQDLDLLAAQHVQVPGIPLPAQDDGADANKPLVRTPDAVFLPSVQEMYPSGISQEVSSQKGTFVEVKGYGHQMEGASRPTFFRGVATVVIKLFNVVEPTNAYFGQKDIQQALILRRLCKDLLLSHPDPAHLHIVPTTRDPADGLALSSRNAYLTPEDRKLAGTLHAALKAAEQAWLDGLTKGDCVKKAVDIVESASARAQITLDYVEMNDPQTFDVLDSEIKRGHSHNPSDPIILSGAIRVGKTRLIDNIILGDASQILG